MGIHIFNEMSDDSGYARPHYEAFDNWLKGISRETVQVKQTEADLIFRRTGITFSLNGDEGGTERLKLQVFHETSYRYDQLIRRSIQMLRMTPSKTQRQNIIHWQLDLPGKATPWTDAFGNLCHCLVLDNATQDIVLRARRGGFAGVRPR